MKYNDLQVEKNTRPTRRGRGISAGLGKTAGRGTKGQKWAANVLSCKLCQNSKVSRVCTTKLKLFTPIA